MNIERLKNLANTDFTNFIHSENNVKYKIIIPFLQAFNHVDLDLEHAAQGSRIDINIGNRIIVETKALGQNINTHVKQLADYCGKELPVLAILTNGRHFRIYSPQWRQLRAFTEKIIYEFELKHLNDIHLLNRLEKILDFTNYDNLEYIDHIEQREKEILKIKLQIDELKLLKKSEVNEVKNEIQELKSQIQELNEQIKLKEKFVNEVESGNIPELESLASDYLIPFLVTMPAALSQSIIATPTVMTLSSTEITYKTKPRKTSSPSARDWVERIPELRGIGGLNSWKDLCDYFIIAVDGDSARRRLKIWVEQNRPSWERVPEPKK